MPTYRGPAARYKRYSKRFLNNACIRISRIYLLSLARIRGEGETRVWQWTIRLYYLHYPFRLPARRSRYFLLFNFSCMHYFPHSDRSLKILRAKTSPVIPSLLPLSLSLSLSPQLSFDAPQDVPTTRSNSNSSSFQTWNIWIQILEILNSKYRGGRAKWRGGEKMDAKVIRFDIPDGRRKIKFQFEFPYLPIYIYIYIYTRRGPYKFSLLSSRMEARRRG